MSDLIKRADAIGAVHNWYNQPYKDLKDCIRGVDKIALDIEALPSADAIDVNEVTIHYKPYPSAEATGDLISRASALEEMAMAECGCSYSICVRDNCDCSYISRIKGLPSDEPTAEEVWGVAQKVFYSTLTYREAVDYLKEVEEQHERFNQQSRCD